MRLSTCKIAAALTLILSACSLAEITPAEFDRAQPRTQAEINFAKQTLSALQVASFAENREYCGYIYLNDNGAFEATQPKRGRKGSCLADDPYKLDRLLASYHTHGAYSEDFESELPSTDDLISDIEERIDGYVATPGGRFWFTDAGAATAVMLCDAGCIAADPNYDPRDTPQLKQSYSLNELIALEE